MLFIHLQHGLLSGLFPFGFPTKIQYVLLPSSCYMPCPSHPPLLDHSNCRYTACLATRTSYTIFCSLPTLHSSSAKIFSSAPCSQTSSVYVILLPVLPKIYFVIIIYLTASGFLPSGNGNTIVTTHKITRHARTNHSTQNYTTIYKST
jgi:hypothetical protein